jgi:hypothetical protein
MVKLHTDISADAVYGHVEDSAIERSWVKNACNPGLPLYRGGVTRGKRSVGNKNVEVAQPARAAVRPVPEFDRVTLRIGLQVDFPPRRCVALGVSCRAIPECAVGIAVDCIASDRVCMDVDMCSTGRVLFRAPDSWHLAPVSRRPHQSTRRRQRSDRC